MSEKLYYIDCRWVALYICSEKSYLFLTVHIRKEKKIKINVLKIKAGQKLRSIVKYKPEVRLGDITP